jgi:hypothetical protein
MLHFTDVTIFVGVSSGILVILLASIMTFVILGVRRRRRKSKQGIEMFC